MSDTTESRGILASSAVMATGTVFSRGSGYVRNVLLAAAIGNELHADLFNIGNTIPNMLYILLAGGVFNAVLVPQLVRAQKNDPDGGEAYTNRVITLALVFLGAVTILLVLAAPLVMRLYLNGSYDDPALAAQRDSAIMFARYCLPQVFFYGMFVLLGQVLNARGRFGPMMWAPIANNAIAILVLVLYLFWFGALPATDSCAAYSSTQELVLGVPPIHPIGTTNRKGRNNAPTAETGDPGSPWAIGGPEGGHDAIHPELGTEKDFDRLVEAGRKHGVEVALDFAIQCSPDHPWLGQHPEWFNRRPDGTLKYAENPPKRYQDIYNVNFDSEDWVGLWEALRDVVLHWCKRGVRVYRVDNPHTKSVPFWEWLIGEVRAEFPDTIFFAEAFTRPAMMTTLAKIGFSQSYTYFTWKNTKAELKEFLELLLGWTPFYRPNFFVNTPDILHEYLQHGGRPAFEARLVLAATLSPSYGIYSGYEHFENVPVAVGSEEYLDSEKYELKQRALDGPLLPLVQQLNEIRRAEPALQRFENLRLLDTHGEHVFAYLKGTEIAVAVNLDPRLPREDVVVVPPGIGLPDEFPVLDLLTGAHYRWRIGRNYVGLVPGGAHVLKVGA